jgi:inositol-phosphate transport system permease protein
MRAGTLDTPVATPVARDWRTLARRGLWQRTGSQSALLAFLLIVSLPILLPYFWMVVISFTARSGGVSTDVLWTTCAVIVPAVMIYSVVHLMTPSTRLRTVAAATLLAVAVALLAALVGDKLHFANYRFLWRTNIIEEIRTKATAGGQFPSVWIAFRNSLALALSQTLIILAVASLAGYYISRFAFRGREAFLQGMLVLHAFPAMTLIIPIFLILYWVGLLDTILGVMLVLATIELPFYVFVMKGFFDAVPWDIEMSAMTDGRDAPPGLLDGRAPAGARRLDRRRRVRVHPRVGRIHFCPHDADREQELGDEPVPVLGLRRHHGRRLRYRRRGVGVLCSAEPTALRVLPKIFDADDDRRHSGVMEPLWESRVDCAAGQNADDCETIDAGNSRSYYQGERRSRRRILQQPGGTAAFRVVYFVAASLVYARYTSLAASRIPSRNAAVATARDSHRGS